VVPNQGKRPKAQFDWVVERDGTVQFTDKSTQLSNPTYHWRFGNSDSTTAQHPQTRLFGTTSVRLVVTNDSFCSDSLTQVVKAWQPLNFKAYPNPATSVLWVETPTDLAITIWNPLGQLLQNIILSAGKNKILLDDWAQGFYYLRYEGGVFPFLKL
jgi:hypothetical protein